MKKFDVIVIGAGPAGYAAAMRAVDFKKKVALIEKDKLGGAGIHNGALWSKTLWEISTTASMLRTQGSGLNVHDLDFQMDQIYDEVNTALDGRVNQLQHHMDQINIALEGDFFEYIEGSAKVVSKNGVAVESEGTTQELAADYIILATGSRPRKLSHLSIDEEIVMTSDGLPKMNKFPKSIVILGAGVIGCEFATIFSGFGQTKVHLIDKGDRILPFEDEDVVRVVEKSLEERGVLIHRNSRLTDMKVVEGAVQYNLEYTDGSTEVFDVEKALISVGRVPNYENLIDKSLGLEVNNRGIVDELTQTSVSNIYAVGDITADISLVNVGELEGRYAVERIFGEPSRPLTYENISTIMFLAPEVSGVGMNELQAQQADLNYRVASLDYSCIPRAVAMRNTEGFIKIIIGENDYKILGMRVVGRHSSSAIQAIALLISDGRGIEELAELIHPHPSIIEGIQECCRMLLNKSIMKPKVLTEAMYCRAYREGVYTEIAN
ncbi:MAG: pyridine nucleotide-disulfide oxidoreductase [Flammeovirgaceae bacterium TMED32]|nr:MAG: pyridine nucleotide-disulfide oxidoreductase [Flammeovirgaceae bacterium TMED32]